MMKGYGDVIRSQQEVSVVSNQPWESGKLNVALSQVKNPHCSTRILLLNDDDKKISSIQDN